MLKKIKIFWGFARRLSGDDAYEQYLIQYADTNCNCDHANEKPLDKKAFFKKWQDGKWAGIKRCC